jgi:hypothetical protein
MSEHVNTAQCRNPKKGHPVFYNHAENLKNYTKKFAA